MSNLFKFMSEVSTNQTLQRLVSSSSDEARKVMEEHGLTAEQQDALLGGDEEKRKQMLEQEYSDQIAKPYCC